MDWLIDWLVQYLFACVLKIIQARHFTTPFKKNGLFSLNFTFYFIFRFGDTHGSGTHGADSRCPSSRTPTSSPTPDCAICWPMFTDSDSASWTDVAYRRTTRKCWCDGWARRCRPPSARVCGPSPATWSGATRLTAVITWRPIPTPPISLTPRAFKCFIVWSGMAAREERLFWWMGFSVRKSCNTMIRPSWRRCRRLPR